MKLTFLGTRGNIEARSRRHRRHSALLVSYHGNDVMIDAGADWRGQLGDVGPDAIVVTHAHPDHAWGLKDGAPCPVHATEEAWNVLSGYSLKACHTVSPCCPLDVQGITVEAFPVAHSTRAPTVAYRITAGRVTIFYAPDVAHLPDRAEALAGVQCYVGDGATVTQSMVRKQGDTLIGHAPIRQQLTWCQKSDVPAALFTHCGSEITEGDERTLGANVHAMGQERDVEAQIAHDGMELVLR